MKEKKLWFIHAGTGCTCCNDEDHLRGPYKSEEDAKRRIKFYRTGDYYPLASQYARRGQYSVIECEVEEISDGRIIVEDCVYSKDKAKPIEVKEDGSVEDNEKEWFSNRNSW